MNRRIIVWLLAIFTVGAWQCVSLEAQGTTFMYQGHLVDNGSAANGNYDFQFSLYNAAVGGEMVAGPITNLNVAVAGGLFTTNINFGAVFNGDNYWLAVGVRTNGSNTNAFTALTPLQPVLPVPYSMFATTASNLMGTVSAGQLSGTLTSTQLSGTYSSTVSFTNAANDFSGTFVGDGSGLQNLNGSQVTSGTVADARLSTNVAFLNRNQTFTGQNYFTNVNTFTNRGNSFVGSFYGNGLVGWIPVSVTSTQAMPDAGYLLLSSNLTTVTLPPTSSLLLGDVVRVSGAGAGGWMVAQNAGESIQGFFLSANNAAWYLSAAGNLGWATIAASADGNKLAASTYSGGIYTSINGGQSWSVSSSQYSPTLLASSASGSTLIGAIGRGNTIGGIVYSTNSGTTWASASVTSENWDSIVVSANGNNAAAVVYNGGIYVSTNSGATWRATSATTQQWISIASSADGSKLAAAVYNGYIYTSVNGGTNWTQQANSTDTSWYSIASSSDGSKLVGVAGSGIYTSSNYGANWTKQTNAPSGVTFGSIACSQDGGTIFATFSPGILYVSSNFGLSWTAQSVPSTTWQSVTCSADGSKAAAAYATTSTSGQIYYWQPSSLAATTTAGTTGSLSGAQYSAVELQYIGNGMFIPLSSSGQLWAN